jgi:hypothetical protein
MIFLLFFAKSVAQKDVFAISRNGTVAEMKELVEKNPNSINEQNENGFTQPEQNIKYLLGLANTSQLREILKYGTIDVVTASSVFANLDI